MVEISQQNDCFFEYFVYTSSNLSERLTKLRDSLNLIKFLCVGWSSIVSEITIKTVHLFQIIHMVAEEQQKWEQNAYNNMPVTARI